MATPQPELNVRRIFPLPCLLPDTIELVDWDEDREGLLYGLVTLDPAYLITRDAILACIHDVIVYLRDPDSVPRPACLLTLRHENIKQMQETRRRLRYL